MAEAPNPYAEAINAWAGKASQQEPSGTSLPNGYPSADGPGWQQAAAQQAQQPATATPPGGVDPAMIAAFMSAAAAGQMPGVPAMPPQPGYPGWPGSSSAGWPQPPVANPPAHSPAQQPAQVQGKGAWDPRSQAAMAMWAHQWAAHMVATQQQQQQYASGSGWPADGASGSQWPDTGMPAWPPATSWPDASSWSGSAPSAATGTAPAEGDWSSYAGASYAAASNQSAGALSGSAAEREAYAASLLEQMKGDTSTADASDAPRDPSPPSTELDAEGQALCEDMSSAVAKFLAGDGFESDSEPEDDYDEPQQAAAASQPAVAAQPSALAHSSVPDHAPPPPPQAAPPPQSAHTAPLSLASAAFSAAGLMPPAATTSAGSNNMPIQAEQGGPSAEGVQDFLSVLRRRALPAELSEDKMKHIATVISNCVVSLYRDRIRPVQNNVQRRLRERNCSEAVVQALLQLCARESETYRILPPTGSRLPVILLLQEPKWFEGFVDTEAPEGSGGAPGYSADAWEALTSFLSNDQVSLPSQPYQAALELRQLNLPHLQNLCLGEIEHMVRLSMGKRRLLTFHGDSLKPVRVVRSLEQREKMQRAKAEVEDTKGARGIKGGAPGSKGGGAASGAAVQQPFVAAPVPAADEAEITDKDDLTVVLIELMAKFPEGVSLSLMKQHVQSHCKRSLNESAFKCSKLAEVFKLAPLSNIFPLQQMQDRNEIIVKPPNKSEIPNHIWQKYYHLKEHGGLAQSVPMTGPLPAAYGGGGGAAAEAAA